MARIELCDDGWFELGKDSVGSPLATTWYQIRQDLKYRLVQLSNRNLDGETLRKSLDKIEVLWFEHPYAKDNEIYVADKISKIEHHIGKIIE